jgi:hypothetical protein
MSATTQPTEKAVRNEGNPPGSHAVFSISTFSTGDRAFLSLPK